MPNRKKSKRRNRKKFKIKSILRKNETWTKRNDSSQIQLMGCLQKSRNESWNEFESLSKRNLKDKSIEKNRTWNGKGNLNLLRLKILDSNLMLWKMQSLKSLIRRKKLRLMFTRLRNVMDLESFILGTIV